MLTYRYAVGSCKSTTVIYWKIFLDTLIALLISNALKASANKNAILVFAFQTPQHFTYFGWTFVVQCFSRVYHPHRPPSGPKSDFFYLGRLGGDRLQKKIWPRKFIRSTWNVAVFEMQIRELHFYLTMPFLILYNT